MAEEYKESIEIEVKAGQTLVLDITAKEVKKGEEKDKNNADIEEGKVNIYLFNQKNEPDKSNDKIFLNDGNTEHEHQVIDGLASINDLAEGTYTVYLQNNGSQTDSINTGELLLLVYDKLNALNHSIVKGILKGQTEIQVEIREGIGTKSEINEDTYELLFDQENIDSNINKGEIKIVIYDKDHNLNNAIDKIRVKNLQNDYEIPVSSGEGSSLIEEGTYEFMLL